MGPLNLAVKVLPLFLRTEQGVSQARNVHFASILYHYRFVPPLRDGEIEDEDDEWNVERFEEEDVELAAEQLYTQSLEEDDGMQWEGDFSATPVPSSAIPDALQPGSLRELKEQQNLRVQQQLLLQQQQLQQLQHQQQQQQQQVLSLQTSGSREISEEQRRVDPADVSETLKVTVTPTIAREEYTVPVSNKQLQKLRKEPSRESKDTTEDEGKDKKKGSMFCGLFGRKKEKEKGTKETKSAGSASITSVESGYTTPDLEDLDRSTPRIILTDGTTSPTTSGPTAAGSG